MSSSAAADDATTVTAAANSPGGSNSPSITKHNIDSFNYFHLFGLTVPVDGASADDVDVATVRRVYRRLSLRFHPDKDDSDAARHAFEVVRTALETVIDPSKRATYLTSLIDSNNAGGKGKAGSHEVARQRQRTQQAQEEAQWAADLLVQREQQRRAKEAAARQAAQEREEATQQLLSELTNTLNTPFQQMEAELVRDWDVDEEMVEMKMKEMMKLLRQLTPVEHIGGAPRKRDRETAKEEL